MSGNDNSKRSIGQIISDATDEELKDYHKILEWIDSAKKLKHLH